MSRIFISYRRADTAMAAGWLYYQLSEYFPGQLFMDIDDIPPGEDFVRVIEDAISQCRVVLVLIGPDWVSDRLNDPLDFVRLEVSTALSRPNVRVVPVLGERCIDARTGCPAAESSAAHTPQRG